MFKKSRFIFKANGALAQLGIDPLRINDDVRSGVWERCLGGGKTPHEAALIIFARMYSEEPDVSTIRLIDFPPIVKAAIHDWENEGLIERDFMDGIIRVTNEAQKQRGKI